MYDLVRNKLQYKYHVMSFLQTSVAFCKIMSSGRKAEGDILAPITDKYCNKSYRNNQQDATVY